jgi:hypothetical protein
VGLSSVEGFAQLAQLIRIGNAGAPPTGEVPPPVAGRHNLIEAARDVVYLRNQYLPLGLKALGTTLVLRLSPIAQCDAWTYQRRHSTINAMLQTIFLLFEY